MEYYPRKTGKNRFVTILQLIIHGEWNELPKNVQDCSGKGKDSLKQSPIIFHFCFAQKKRNTIGWKMMHCQLILIDDIPGWPNVNDCHTFRNTMLMEIRNIMITPFSSYQDCSLLLVAIGEWFLRCVRLYFLQFSGIFKPTNQKAEKWLPAKHYSNKSHHICLKVSPRTKLISYPSRCWKIDVLKKKEPSQRWISNFLTQWKVLNVVFDDGKVLTECSGFANDMFPLNSRNIVDPTQLDPDQKVQTNCLLLVVFSLCKVVMFCSWNTSVTGAFGLAQCG